MSCAILCRAYSAVCWILDFIFVCTWLNKNFLLIFQKRKKKKEKRIHDRYSNTNCCKTKFSSLLPAFGSQMEHQNTQLSWKIIVKLHILRLILLAYTRGKKIKKKKKRKEKERPLKEILWSSKISPFHQAVTFFYPMHHSFTLRFRILECNLTVQSPSLALKQLLHGEENTPKTEKCKF